jgi:AcrR family transcriptional regulator
MFDYRQTVLYGNTMRKSKPVGSVRERLLQAAGELFYREGVHTVGIDRILEYAGVAKASLYSTFGSKDELVRAYLEESSEWLRARVETSIARFNTPHERILAVFDEFADRVAGEVYFGCPFIRSCSEETSTSNAAREVSSMFRAWRQRLFAELARELDASNADEMGKQFSMIYDGIAVAVWMECDSSAALTARKIVENLLSKTISDLPKKQKQSKSMSRRVLL